MGFLFSRRGTPTQPPAFSGQQIQTSTACMPIPIIYGSPRVSVNLIYANDFKAVQTQVKGSSGKGLLAGGSSKGGGGQAQTTYYGTLALALGEGPLGSLVTIYQDQAIYTPANWPMPMTFISGTTGQAPWSYLVTAHPADALSYSDTAYFGAANYQLDSSATAPQFNFVINGLLAGTCPLNIFSNSDGSYTGHMEADPAQVIYDFLTNQSHGVMFPASLIDGSLFSGPNATNPIFGDAAYQTYCQAVGFGFSIVLNSAEQASAVLERWAKITNTAVVWTGVTLKFIPYGDTAQSNNPGWDISSGLPRKFYTPNVPVLFNLTDSDFIQSTTPTEDPIIYERTDLADVYNTVRVSIKDRNNAYNDSIVEAKDDNAVELTGIRVDNLADAKEYPLQAYAAVAAQAILQRNVAIRNRFTFKLSWEYCILDPMDIVSLTDTNLGLNQFPVRIISIEENDKYELTVVAEEFNSGSSSPTLYQKQGSQNALFNTNSSPGSVNFPFIFEPTSTMMAALGQTQPSIAIGLSAGPNGVYNPAFGGADVFISLDNITYAFQGRFSGVSTMGILTGTLPVYSGGNPDNIDTLAVDLTESNGTLTSVTEAQAAAGNLNLCAIINGSGQLELISVKNCNLSAPHKYNITGLYRAQYGTTAIAAHAGDQFLFISNNQLFNQVLPSQYVGQVLYFKFPAFNIYQQAEQALSAAIVYQFTPTGVGTGPGSPGYPTYSVRIITSNTNVQL